MLKTILIAVGCSVVTAATTIVYVGRTVLSSPFQLDAPVNSAIKVAQDPANVWSWHHEFQNAQVGIPVNANVLVDFDGNGVMDTEYPWVRVTITDLEIVSPAGFTAGIATISDGTGKRYSVGLGASSTGVAATVQHVSLTTP